jgi:hypothetical protein
MCRRYEIVIGSRGESYRDRVRGGAVLAEVVECRMKVSEQLEHVMAQDEVTACEDPGASVVSFSLPLSACFFSSSL